MINGIDDLLGKIEIESGTAEAVKSCFKILESARRFSDELNHYLLDGKLTLSIQPAERGKCKVLAKNAQAKTLAMDVFKLADADKRNKFVRQIDTALSLTPEEKAGTLQELMNLADVFKDFFKGGEVEVSNNEVIETSFQILKDGRVVEQIRGGFAVYDPETGEHYIVDSVTDSDGATYKPVDDALFSRGGFYVADDLVEYGSEKELIEDIKKYVSKYLDLKPLHLFIASIYILFTYLADKTYELSYINATGDSGSGKSRFGNVIAIAARRGLPSVTPSAASIYRVVDKFQPTLFLDEFNSDANADDAAALIQILNAGASRIGSQIMRQVKGADGNFETKLYDCYCPKIIGSLKLSASGAFNSRCIPIPMERTTRNDIPLRVTPQMLANSQEIRNKLALFRLRNYHKDLEESFDKAEAELRMEVLPRSVQLNTPLFALIEDADIKRQFIKLLKGRDEDLHEEKQNSTDGQIVQAIHTVLFTIDGEQDGEVIVSLNFNSLPADGEKFEELRVEKLLSIVNSGRPGNHEISSQYFGKQISGLGLKTKKILRRQSEYRTQRAILFDRARLSLLFRLFGLPVSEELKVTNVTKVANSSSFSSLEVVTIDGSGVVQEDVCYQTKLNDFNDYRNGNYGNNENPDTEEVENGHAYLEQMLPAQSGTNEEREIIEI